jgi:hypothetical protein
MTFTSTQIYIGADWLPEPGRHKAHPASLGTRRPCLVALPGPFSCLLSCKFPPPSWMAPSLRISLRSRCRLAWCLAGRVLESAGDGAVLAIKARATLAVRVTTLTCSLSFRHSPGLEGNICCLKKVVAIFFIA